MISLNTLYVDFKAMFLCSELKHKVDILDLLFGEKRVILKFKLKRKCLPIYSYTHVGISVCVTTVAILTSRNQAGWLTD
jgi:hypothetical protein